jgi:hypothetical protein
MCFKAASCTQGGVVLVWKENNLKFKVTLVLLHGSNTVTFQLAMGDKQFYVVGMYIPPNCTRGWRIYGKQHRHARQGANCLSWGISMSMLGSPVTSGRRSLLTCLRRHVWLNHRADIGSGLLAGPPPGHDGRGAKKGG